MSQGLLDAQNGGASSKGGARAAGGLSRRTFLKFGVTVGAAAGGGLLLGFSMPAASQDQKAGKSVIGGDGVETPQSGVFAPNAFIQIDTAGKVTLVIPKVEMGQGVYTSIPMLIAEELEVPLDSITVDHAPPNEKLFMDPLLGGQLTGGSTSIRYAWEPMRKAGATARTGRRHGIIGIHIGHGRVQRRVGQREQALVVCAFRSRQGCAHCTRPYRR